MKLYCNIYKIQVLQRFKAVQGYLKSTHIKVSRIWGFYLQYFEGFSVGADLAMSTQIQQ